MSEQYLTSCQDVQSYFSCYEKRTMYTEIQRKHFQKLQVQKALLAFGCYRKSLMLKPLWDVDHVLKHLEPTLKSAQSSGPDTYNNLSHWHLRVKGRAGQRLAWGTDTRGWPLSRGFAGNRVASDSAWAPGQAQQEGCVGPLHLLPPPLLLRTLTAAWSSGPLPEEAEEEDPVLSLLWDGDCRGSSTCLFSSETVLGSPHNLWTLLTSSAG